MVVVEVYDVEKKTIFHHKEVGKGAFISSNKVTVFALSHVALSKHFGDTIDVWY